MSLWLRVRGAPRIVGAVVLTLIGLALPGSAVAASASPAGATLAAACFLALVVPVAVGWGCGRGDPLLESASARPVHAFDLLLAALAVGTTSAAALALAQAGLAPAGFVAGRDLLAYLGFMLAAYPLAGWRVATFVPAVYLLAVAVFGRGEDTSHPAAWAWIAADGRDQASWIATIAVLFMGIGAAATLRPRVAGSPAD